jgi:hypothetical protein
VVLPTGVPAPEETETEVAISPSAAPASAEAKGNGSDPALRAVQAAVGLALLLGLLGGFGLYMTREHE